MITADSVKHIQVLGFEYIGFGYAISNGDILITELGEFPVK